MIDDVIAHLEASGAAFKQVGGAAQFQNAAESNPRATPAAFVIPLEENPGVSAMGDLVIQRVAVTLGVILVVRNLSDSKGVAARQDMETLRQAVKAALLGWQPPGGYDPLERGRSGLLAFKDGHMWWQDIYLTSYIDRSVL
jgi:hypothetical protein